MVAVCLLFAIHSFILFFQKKEKREGSKMEAYEYT